jgi:hypothetical protein
VIVGHQHERRGADQLQFLQRPAASYRRQGRSHRSSFELGLEHRLPTHEPPALYRRHRSGQAVSALESTSLTHTKARQLAVRQSFLHQTCGAECLQERCFVVGAEVRLPDRGPLRRQRGGGDAAPELALWRHSSCCG